jgi:hypothetical protein
MSNALVVVFSVYKIFNQFSTNNVYTFEFNISKLAHLLLYLVGM